MSVIFIVLKLVQVCEEELRVVEAREDKFALDGVKGSRFNELTKLLDLRVQPIFFPSLHFFPDMLSEQNVDFGEHPQIPRHHCGQRVAICVTFFQNAVDLLH